MEDALTKVLDYLNKQKQYSTIFDLAYVYDAFNETTFSKSFENGYSTNISTLEEYRNFMGLVKNKYQKIENEKSYTDMINFIINIEKTKEKWKLI
jgi:hypothetical protein